MLVVKRCGQNREYEQRLNEGDGASDLQVNVYVRGVANDECWNEAGCREKSNNCSVCMVRVVKVAQQSPMTNCLGEFSSSRDDTGVAPVFVSASVADAHTELPMMGVVRPEIRTRLPTMSTSSSFELLESDVISDGG